MSMSTDEIRRTYLEFFGERDHRRLASGSLVPASFDPSVLLTTAGMQPLKPYFLGQEPPPHPRLTSCQRCFRTVDIDVVGTTARHLTFFEMLGNFSVGDYFKERAIELAWELSTDGFRFDAERIWVTVFGGDEELGLGPDEEAIALWQARGVPRERIVELPRSENFWQAGPTGPCGPCSELYLDRGPEHGADDDLPGGDNDRFLEYWNLVFMAHDQNPPGTLAPLPFRSIDTGLGLNRMAAIQQGAETVFDTDQFRPLIELGESLSQRAYREDDATDRALRILADHARGTTFLIADGVVPSNEDRGYVLRRIMRRAIAQGRSLGMEPGFLGRYGDVVIETMGGEYPELGAQREAIAGWLAAEEEGFGRTLDQGTRRLAELIERVEAQGATSLPAEETFALHDTFGLPIDIQRDIAREHGLAVDEPGFEEMMGAQRARARAAASGSGATDAPERERAAAFAAQTGFPTRFTGYEAVTQETTVGAVRAEDGTVLLKLEESPFYAQGGGQVSDSGRIECVDGDCALSVRQVYRLGDDQAVAVDVLEGKPRDGARVIARVDAPARHATEANHTATHLLHAALRERLGAHVRQAGSYVGPDKLRFDFTHGGALSPGELAEVVERVNGWIQENLPVRPQTTTLEEARRLGAMALFGEKYGEVVRMVEVGDGSFSRELCGGTHVRRTAEIGVFHVLSETSSAANVRRIEAVTGPEAAALLRRHDALLAEAAAALRVTPERLPEAVAEREARRRELEKGGGAPPSSVADVEALAARAEPVDGATVLTQAAPGTDADGLLAIADRLKARLGDAAIVLGTAHEGRVHLVASVAPALVARGVRAGAIVKVAAEVTGGGGGGRDTMARAGGRDPERLDDALRAARTAIEEALAG